MKFQPDSAPGVNSITRIEPGRIFVGGTAFEGALVVPWAGTVQPWAVAGFEALQAGDFSALLQHRPELVVFGSGSRLRFAHPALLAGLINAGVGVETMDTAAACRTYNVLASEGRSVLAALLPG